MQLQFISSALLQAYTSHFPKGLSAAFAALTDAELSTPDFSFYTSVASVFSSKIEGEDIELDSYIKHKRDGVSFQPDYTKKTDDLYSAYVFAQQNPLNETHLKEAHRLLSSYLLAQPWQGQYRTQNMYVTTEDGRIEYVAALPQALGQEMEKFFSDVETLLQSVLTMEEAFYYASMIHLVFVKIHPWNDGNGRCARLLEKWFLAEKMGPNAWFLQSEKGYYQQHQIYYRNIRALGLEYETLDYGNSLPFLMMLPAVLTEK